MSDANVNPLSYLTSTPTFQSLWSAVENEIVWGEEGTRVIVRELVKIECLLLNIQEAIVSEQSEINTLAADLQTVATNLATAVTELSAEIEALQNNNPQLDLSALTSAVTAVQSAASSVTNLAPAAPTVTGVSPNTGPAAGGTSVTITGTGFTGATAVDFGTGAAAASFTVVSATSITAVSPAGSDETVDITVTGPGGTSAVNTADEFIYAG